MSRMIARAETWERVYTAFSDVNFAAFDYNTIKQSLLDYLKLYFSETFNDFIESSELIAIVEVFAYIGELLAYRVDVSSHENFITVAQRKDSILRLAKFISYTASRPIPARGLVKITSITTSESVIDANGNDLANRTIRWNDVSNPNWKEQFILVMNRILSQEFGSVRPTDRFQIQDVLFELYSLNTVPQQNGVFAYTANASGQSLPMELVPITYTTTNGIVERRPQNNSNFTIVYGQDGLGDSSDTTGFFCFTKQGTLQKFQAVFDGITPNQTYEIAADNINDTDVWINNIDPVTGNILDLPSLLPYRHETTDGKSGEWIEVDLAHAQNVIFNTNPRRNKYELETLLNNRLRVIFGDGEFADIPSGSFDIWARTSVDQDIVIPQASVVNAPATSTYVDSYNRTQTFSFTFSLIGSLQNASASESMEHVRVTAPAVYYSQDRMVNGKDYNVFMLQDPSILKLRAINRTFTGDSKYIAWHDPSTTYENVKIFGDDGMVYFQDVPTSVATPTIDANTLISTYVEPLLSSTDVQVQILAAGVAPNFYRMLLNTTEKTRITAAVEPPPVPASVDMYYNTQTYEWFAIKRSDDPTVALGSVGWPQAFITSPIIQIDQTSIFETQYTVTRVAKRLVFQSPTTKFWNTNNAMRVVEYDTLNSDYDNVVVLQANPNNNRSNILLQNWSFYVLGQENIIAGPDIGLIDNTRISVLPVDVSGSGVPPGLNPDVFGGGGLSDIFNVKQVIDLSQYITNNTFPATGVDITLPIYYVKAVGDVVVYDANNNPVPSSTITWIENPAEVLVTNKIRVFHPGFQADGVTLNTSIKVRVNEYVYMTRPTPADAWYPAVVSVESMSAYAQSVLANTGLWIRYAGRAQLNFAWFHRSPRYHLVDPAPTNIIDTFIITKGYYLNTKRWLDGETPTKPDAPTPFDMRASYGHLLDNKMISDEDILHPGRFKILFGPRAQASLQCVFQVIKSQNSTLTDNQIKTEIVSTIRNFFDISVWEFGETFFFTELATEIHNALPSDISSVVLVPTSSNNMFGTLFQVKSQEDEVFIADVDTSLINIVAAYNPTNIKMQS